MPVPRSRMGFLHRLFPRFSTFPWNVIVGVLLFATLALAWQSLCWTQEPSWAEERLFHREWARWWQRDENGKVQLSERPGDRPGTTIRSERYTGGWREDFVLSDESKVFESIRYDPEARVRRKLAWRDGKPTGPGAAWDEAGRLRIQHEPGPRWWPWTHDWVVWDEAHARFVAVRWP